ncbi:uncharacterized protein LOC142362308 isoform X2 [Opisthocomus hoazin]|uniref:uncharacterized protein LOC142362308 isoform X2 n=1 Tax=Opisthocomus hoazin TaxID=30419 RepID=UPI003F538396
MKSPAAPVTALLLVLLSSALGGRAGAPERQPGAGGHGEDPWPPGDGGDNLPRDSSEGSRLTASTREAMGEVPPGPKPPSKATAKAPLGSSEQHRSRKPRGLPPQPSRSRTPGLSHLLKGHGRFNGDTHSCPGIQSRPCQKPSDCGGCLGLYTCKPPTGTCALKAVSRQRGGFLRSIRSAEGRRVPLIPQQRGSA